MFFITPDTLLTGLDAAIKLVALVLDFLNALKTLLGITTSISTLLSSRPWQHQWQLPWMPGSRFLYIAFKFKPSYHPQSLNRSLRLAARPASS